MVTRCLALLLVTWSCVGCLGAGAGAPPHPASSAPTKEGRASGRAIRPDAAADLPEWRLSLRPLAASGHLRVTIETTHLEARRWTLPAREALSELSARDADGPIVIAERAGGGVALEPRRALSAPLSLSYEVAPSAASPCSFELTPDRAAFCGAAVVAMPAAAEAAASIEIRLLADGDYYRAAASSFGLEPVTTVAASFRQIGRAGFLFGDVHHARFEAHEGRDHAAWLGYFAFDPRWVAAEAAGVRTAVDRWLGIRRPPTDPTVGLLFVGIRDTSPLPRISPLQRGALIEAGPSAVWSLRSRLDLTRQLVQRTLGGAVSLGEPGAAWWFDEGIAHAVALEVLIDVGAVELDEAAAEVSGWLAEEALSEHAGAPLGELVAAATDQAPEAAAAARRLLAIRGALLGLALGGPAGGDLQRRLRRALELRAQQDGPLLTADAFFAAAPNDALDHPSQVASLRGAFESGRPIPLPRASLGPCLALVPRTVHRFDLGFTRQSDGGRATVATVDPAGPAARAGVREGDTIVAFDHLPDRSDVAAELALRRDQTVLKIRYLPRGEAHLARALTLASHSGVCAQGG